MKFHKYINEEITKDIEDKDFVFYGYNGDTSSLQKGKTLDTTKMAFLGIQVPLLSNAENYDYILIVSDKQTLMDYVSVKSEESRSTLKEKKRKLMAKQTD